MSLSHFSKPLNDADSSTVKITKVETIHVGEFANILFVQIHTDEGLVGLGDTYYTPETTRTFIHEVGAPMLIGHDPRDVE